MRLLNRVNAIQLFLITTSAYILGFVAHALYLKKTVYGDGYYYFSWLYLAYSNNKFAIGPAILWAPVFTVTHNEFAVGVVGVLATIFGLVLLYDALTSMFSKLVSIMAIITVAGATNLLFYGSLDTVNSHAASFFAVSVFVALLLRRRHWFAIGLSLGLVGLMRTQDLLLAILLIPYITKKNITPIAFGTLLAFAPQLIAWNLTTGRWLVSPYLTGNEGFNPLRPHILGVLFEPRNGLFLWTPATIIGVAGLVKSRRYTFLAAFLAELYVVSSWSTWWQGASYSGRMFVSSLPLLTFGIASIYSWLSRFKWSQAYFLLTIIMPLTALNCISIIYFLLTLPNR